MDLTFDTTGLSEDAYVGFCTGVQEAMTRLGYDCEYDESAPDLSYYKVVNVAPTGE